VTRAPSYWLKPCTETRNRTSRYCGDDQKRRRGDATEADLGKEEVRSQRGISSIFLSLHRKENRNRRKIQARRGVDNSTPVNEMRQRGLGLRVV
jgi:hypothetical protein